MVFLWEISTNSLLGQHEAEAKAGVALESLQSHEGFAQQHITPGRAGQKQKLYLYLTELTCANGRTANHCPLLSCF